MPQRRRLCGGEDTEPSSFELLQMRVDKLEKKDAQLEAVAVLQEPIKLFCLLIARKMGYQAWYKLAAALRLEPSCRGTVHTALNDALTRGGLKMTTWDDLTPMTDASKGAFHLGNALTVEELLKKVNGGLLPSASSASQDALTSMLNNSQACGC